MKRFIRYLYEYENGRRMRNVGFVKVESSDGETIIHIHGKGLRLNGEEKLQLYLFFKDQGELSGIWQGEVGHINPAINYRLRYTPEDLGVPENYDKIAGIIIESGGNRRYAAVWDDMPVNVNQMRVWTPPRPEAEEEPGPAMEPEAEEEPGPAMEPEAEEEPGPAIEPEAEEEPVPAIEPEADAQAQQTGQTESPWTVTKIQRNDLVKLPRCEWRLANNGFLLHGYYNYHHLVLLDNGKLAWLGVPGVYHEKEAEAASALGFPEFIPIEQLEISLTDEEWEEEVPFGYWCRQVRRPSYR